MRSALAVLLASLVSACAVTSTGMGGGTIIDQGKPPMPVLVSWTSQDGGITGDLVVTVGDDGYQGRFMQITSDTTQDAVAPMWSGWYDGWGPWPDPWIGEADVTTFTKSYSGRVIANLFGPGQRRMRCRFDLMRPSSGMSGGGQGGCQMSDGKRVDVNIEPR